MALAPLAANPYEQLRWANKPERVHRLLLGESPPDPGKGPLRFFYNPQLRTPDNLYVGVVTALYGDVPDLRDKPKHLAQLKSDGWWLLDAVDYPINRIKDEALRRQAIRDGFRQLRHILERPEVRPEVGVVICMPRVFNESRFRLTPEFCPFGRPYDRSRSDDHGAYSRQEKRTGADAALESISPSRTPTVFERGIVTVTAREVALSTIKSGLSAVPLVGGPLASLLGDALQSHTDHALQRAIELLSERLLALEGRIDLNAVDRDELAELFKSCYLVIVRTHHEQKLKAATALVANVLLRTDDPERLSYTELDHFVRCLDSLSIGAIEVISVVCNLAGPNNLAMLEADPFRVNFDSLRAKMPKTTPDLLMGLVGELNALNLLHVAGIPSIREPEYANYPIELTALGARFVARLLRWD